jgi:hypothetical protein
MNQPQDLYQIVKTGGNAKSFLMALYKRNTGALKLDEIKGEHRTDEIDLADMPTRMMSAVPKSPDPLSTNELVAVILSPNGLYIDQDGRQYLKLIDVSAHTLELVDVAVERFLKLTGRYPDEIIPCPSRYVLLKFKDFAPVGSNPIPYVRNFAFPIDYDVLVRGKREEDQWMR